MSMKWSLGDFIKLIEYILPRRKTKTGLLAAIFFIFVIVYFFTPINKLSSNWQIIIFVLILIILVTFWMFNSGRLVIPSKKIKVALALKSMNPDSQKVVNTTISMINDKLRRLNLKQEFRIFEIGTDMFSTNEEAESYIKRKNINLAIHGTMYSGNTEGKYKYDLKNFSFSYTKNLPQKSLSLDKMLDNDIGLMISQRFWIIEESNNLIDIENISINLVEIILSVIAIGLHRTFEGIEISIQLIEVLLPLLEKKIHPQHKIITISKESSTIKIPTDVLRSGRLRSILISCYLSISRVYQSEGKYTKVEELIYKALKAGANKIDCYVRLASVKYHLNDLQSSKEFTAKINRIIKNDATYLVNMAFYSILDKEYEKITYYYKLLQNKISDNNIFIIEDVLSFLYARKKDDPSELAYLCAIGFLTYKYKSKEQGMALLKEFLDKSESKIEYVKVNKKVKGILKI